MLPVALRYADSSFLFFFLVNFFPHFVQKFTLLHSISNSLYSSKKKKIEKKREEEASLGRRRSNSPFGLRRITPSHQGINYGFQPMHLFSSFLLLIFSFHGLGLLFLHYLLPFRLLTLISSLFFIY